MASAAASWQHRAVVAGARRVHANRLWSTERLASAAVRWAANTARRPKTGAAGRPPRAAVRGLNVQRDDRKDWPVWTLRSRSPRRPARRIVYLHGGAYIGQISGSQYRWCADVVRRTGATAIVPIYPLAPRGTAITIVPAMADLVNAGVAAHGADAVAVAGDSAGGGLALATVQELVSRGVPTPARLVLISPWLDVTISDPASALIDDPLLGAVGLRACGRLWAGGLDPADPRVSPLFGSLAGLPHTDVYAGSLDVLCPDTVRLQQRARAQGADTTVVMREGLIHTWPMFLFLPEARAARPDLHRALVGDPL